MRPVTAPRPRRNARALAALLVGGLLLLTGCTSERAAGEPAPRSSPVTTSGEALPKGDLPHWKQIIAQDFTKPAKLGTFNDVYNGWGGYDRNRDTSRSYRPLATQGLWNSKTTSTVHDGVFDCYLHTEGTTPQVCSVTPTTTGRWWEGRLYGRYSVRFRADAIPGYKIAWLIWPSSNIWAQGELDFPEGYLTESITGAAHLLGKNPIPSPFFVDTGVHMQQWHTATTEWSPGKVTYTLDGKSWTTKDPKVVPTHPMRWALQAESALSKTAPDPKVSGHIYIDWLTEYRYVK